MTRAAEQAERFRATPCPAMASRRKLKSIGLTNHQVEKMLARDGILERAEKNISKPVADLHKDNFTTFIDLLHSLGGEYQAYTPKLSKKHHTDGKLRRDSAKFVLEMSDIDRDKVLNIAYGDGNKEAAMRKEFGDYYFRDDRGCLRRLFAK